MTPLFTLLIGLLFFGLQLRVKKGFGVLLGLAGAIFLILYGNDTPDTGPGNFWFGLLVVGAACCYAISSNTVKAKLQNMHSLTISSTSFVIIGPAGLVLLAQTDFFSTMATSPGAWSALGYVLILSLAGTVEG